MMIGRKWWEEMSMKNGERRGDSVGEEGFQKRDGVEREKHRGQSRREERWRDVRVVREGEEKLMKIEVRICAYVYVCVCEYEQWKVRKMRKRQRQREREPSSVYWLLKKR